MSCTIQITQSTHIACSMISISSYIYSIIQDLQLIYKAGAWKYSRRCATRIFPRSCLVNQLYILNNTVNVLCHAYPPVRAEFSFTKTIGALSRNMSDMMDEGDIHRKTIKTYKGGISHMDLSNKNINHYCTEGRILFPCFYQTEVSLNARLFKNKQKY